MKANELMVGDWVLYHNDGCIDAENDVAPYDENIQIRLSDFERDECFWADLDPIPLTPEILEKNGFKKQGFDGWLLVKQMGNDLAWSILWRTDYSSPHLRIDSYSSQTGSFSSFAVSYVHQLQHALRLCGIDKAIEL